MGILTRQVGTMKRFRSKKSIALGKALLRGRGPNDANISKLPAQLKGQLLAALKFESEKRPEPINDLVWRVDRNGTIHVYYRKLKVQ